MSRTDLHTLLVNLLGSTNVYFQPPESIQLSYPCIIYRKSKIETDHADNNPYNLREKYTITVIDPDPDSTIPNGIAMQSTAFHDRFYTFNNLNHNVFTIYF
jgi:hypothetical protein